MAWGFHYDGPREDTVNYECATCLAKLQKKCPTHLHQFTVDCAHCASAQGGACHAHWGLEAALEYFKANILDPVDAAEFDIAASMALAAKTTQKHIKCTARGQDDEGVREFSVEVRSVIHGPQPKPIIVPAL